jgi:hypothetical protein
MIGTASGGYEGRMAQVNEFARGAALGSLAGVAAAASLMHTNLRLSFDQTLENATGVGAPPWTWPRDELVIDVSHKAVYALVCGALADAMIAPSPGSSARRRALGARLKGFA